MINKEVKLIITDLDGTLLDANEKVPQHFYKQIEELIAAGIIVAIASGRQYSNIRNLFKHDTEKLHFIGDNGALGYFQDKTFHSSYMPWKTAFELVKMGKEIPQVVPLISATHNTYFEPGNPKEVEFIRQFYKQCLVVDNFEDIITADEMPLKVAYYDLAGVKNNSLKLFKNNIPGIVATQSNVNWLDIAPATTNKGEALKVLQKAHNISPEQTMAFGDYHNDIEMLELAIYSFAVASAQEDVKAACNYECKSNKELGAIEIIQHLLDYDGDDLEASLEEYKYQW